MNAKRQKDLSALLGRGVEQASKGEPLVSAPTPPAAVPESATPEPAPRSAPSKGAATSGAVTSEAKPIRAATLVPRDLYKQIKAGHAHQGTFGQLITWACMDYPDEISAEVHKSLQPAGVSRAPRVFGGAATASTRTQIGPVFLPEEDAVVRDLMEQIRASVIGELGAPSGLEVTRTRVHIAALRAWATHHDPSQTSD